MKISIERSGGFAGMTRRADVDTALLAEDERRRIEALARAAEGGRPGGRGAGADAFQYAIAIDGRRYVIRDPSEAWRALIEALPVTLPA